jgi:molybdopterin-guanine dinucleotide biosynthesis protein B
MKVVPLARWSALPPERQHALLPELMAALRVQGQTVALIDASMQDLPFKIGRQAGDTAHHEWSAWQAGAQEVLVARPHGAALITRFEPDPNALRPDLPGLVALLDPRIDWVLALGVDDAGSYKLECWTPAAHELVLYPEDPFVAALLGDPAQPLPEATLRDVLPMHNASAVAQWLQANAHRFDWTPHQGFEMGT